MSSEQFMQMLYLVVLGAAIGGAVMMQHRGRLGRFAQSLAIWILIFLGAAAAYGLWDQIAPSQASRQAVIGPAGQLVIPRAWDGHYYVTARVSGVPVRFVVDTGATNVVLSQRDARRVGIDPRQLVYMGRAQTANGMVRTARVTLHDVMLGRFTVPRVTANVNEGRMGTSLMGMSFLQDFGKIEITRNRMTLSR